MGPRYTPLYEWMSSYPDISHNEACVLSRVLMWSYKKNKFDFHRGCFESYSRIGLYLKLDRRTVIRTIKSLIKKEYLLVVYENKRKRVLYFNERKFRLPLEFASVTESLSKKSASVTESPPSVTESLALVSGCHPTMIVTNNTIDIDDVKQKINSLSEVMTITEKETHTETDLKRRKLLAQCEQLKREK